MRLLLLVLTLWSGATFAADVAVTRQTSPGGVVYLHAAMPAMRYQTLNLGWRGAMRLGSPGDAVMPLLVPDALADGPAGVGGGVFSEALEDLRAGFSVSVSDDALRLAYHAVAADFAEATGHMAALLRAPALTPRHVERLRKDGRLAALHQAQSAEQAGFALTLRRLVGPGPRLAGLIRDPVIFDAADAEPLRDWFARRIARDNLVLAVAGPLTPAEVGPLLDRLASALPPQARLPEAQPPLPAPAPIRIAAVQPVAQTLLFGGALVSGLDAGRRPLADVATSVLWSGFSSRLFAALRERLGAAYSASGQILRVGEGQHAIVIRTAVDPALAVAVDLALAEEYARWWREGLTQAELDGARGRLLMWRREGQRAPAALAAALVAGQLAGEAGDPVAGAEARLVSATLDEVNALIRAHFPPVLPVRVAVAPEGMLPPADCVVRIGADAALCE